MLIITDKILLFITLVLKNEEFPGVCGHLTLSAKKSNLFQKIFSRVEILYEHLLK